MKRRNAFTLVEMLVVIGIIILLIGLLLPMLNIAYTHSVRNRMLLDIQSISAGLEAYKNDHRDYPALDYNDAAIRAAATPASVLLCRALIGPGGSAADGADGPGFRTVPGGAVYGPYIEPSRFKMLADPKLPADPHSNYLADRYNHPICYFRANLGANPAAVYVSANPAANAMYCAADNPAIPLATIQAVLGDSNQNGLIDGNERAVRLPYLLWGPGPDETFGVDMSRGNATAAGLVPACDDTTNFLSLK